MQKSRPSHIIDLTKVEGDGRIRCPKCGVEISPDDTSDKIYTVLEPVLRDDSLTTIVLQCNKCMSKIELVGFGSLDEEESGFPN